MARCLATPTGPYGLAAYNTDYAGALDAITAGMGSSAKTCATYASQSSAPAVSRVPS